MACARCGSRAMVEDVQVVDRSESTLPLEISVRVEREPRALLFKGRVYSTLLGRCCGDCGFLEFYAKDPGALARAAKARGKRK